MFHPISKHFKTGLKNLCASFYLTHFLGFGNRMKHSFECLRYYLNFNRVIGSYITGCQGEFRLRGSWQRLWFRSVNKLDPLFAGIQEMPQCFPVNRSVLCIPRKDEAFPSIQILFVELGSHLSSHPTRDNKPIFFIFIFVLSPPITINTLSSE